MDSKADFKEVEDLAKEQGLQENQRQCPKCKDILTTTHEHDLKKCSCNYLTIDGGNFLRIVITHQKN